MWLKTSGLKKVTLNIMLVYSIFLNYEILLKTV